MSLVVSDSSPLICFCFLNEEHLLHELFGDIYIPPAVAHEISKPHPPLAAVRAEDIPGVKVRPPAALLPAEGMLLRLDQGELEAIALAIELRAELLLIDEALGRRAASGLGLPIIGTLGILGRAKQAGRITVVRPLLDRLRRELGFFVSDELYAHFAETIGESDG